MKIRYSNTIEDVVAFTRYHTAHSPASRHLTWLVRSTFAALLSVAAAYFVVMGDWIWSIAFLCGALSALVPKPWLVNRINERHLRAVYREGDNKGTFGPHELELSPPNLIERTPVNENQRWLGAIEKVAFTNSHIFIYDNGVTAHVIPRASVTDGNCDAFVQALTQEIDKAKHDRNQPARDNGNERDLRKPHDDRFTAE